MSGGQDVRPGVHGPDYRRLHDDRSGGGNRDADGAAAPATGGADLPWGSGSCAGFVTGRKSWTWRRLENGHPTPSPIRWGEGGQSGWRGSGPPRRLGGYGIWLDPERLR